MMHDIRLLPISQIKIGKRDRKAHRPVTFIMPPPSVQKGGNLRTSDKLAGTSGPDRPQGKG